MRVSLRVRDARLLHFLNDITLITSSTKRNSNARGEREREILGFQFGGKLKPQDFEMGKNPRPVKLTNSIWENFKLEFYDEIKKIDKTVGKFLPQRKSSLS